MKRRTLLMAGAVLVLGAVLAAAAVAQNTVGKKADEGRECSPEMMENMEAGSGNMTKTCTPEMMENMMGNKTENHMAGSNHCEGSDMDSMMGNSKGSMM